MFDRISDLDEHVTTIHNKSKNSKCDFCGVEYALKWRLKEHMSSDHKQMQRTCHYYNNEKMCPYESIGCKFAHIEAAFVYMETFAIEISALSVTENSLTTIRDKIVL